MPLTTENFYIKSVREGRDYEGVLMLHLSIAKREGVAHITYIKHFLLHK